ncbi:cupin domain-containing protein [Pseudomonas aeruginosa]|uniref:cupin domain-containing protein n=1 Tax=Pseudomonadota TaxID=1224 RepID=UPI0007648F03|nr:MULTISPECIES: cupin domain-containing protein [Pseudomonadota]ELC7284726.1 cupin domain-containing protein [Pseudomonas aeruginosa]ELJ2354505.1 cupin domain-containing protein [Pseudomonas aeruginosa]KAB0757626.1 cupin domain-containing protein [Pseudomonas aeruginosa]KXA75033.1 cupin [Bordetella hinzii LMG 13501]MCW5475420.1 cupin domain-containing protein [Pseudomonas aeruginosa]
MKVVRGRQVTTNRPWGAVPIAELSGLSVKIHWTDQAYRWHINDGEEVFVVLDGTVDMHHRVDGREQVIELGVGDAFFAEAGCEHRAVPRGEARILVVERVGSP